MYESPEGQDDDQSQDEIPGVPRRKLGQAALAKRARTRRPCSNSQIRFVRPDVAVVHVTGQRDAIENEKNIVSGAFMTLVMTEKSRVGESQRFRTRTSKTEAIRHLNFRVHSQQIREEK